MLGPRRVNSRCWGEWGPTHTLDHHGATPIGCLGPGYLLHIVDHHGADTVRVSITAMGERKVVRPFRYRREKQARAGALCPQSPLRAATPGPHRAALPHGRCSSLALGDGWPQRGTAEATPQVMGQ